MRRESLPTSMEFHVLIFIYPVTWVQVARKKSTWTECTCMCACYKIIGRNVMQHKTESYLQVSSPQEIGNLRVF